MTVWPFITTSLCTIPFKTLKQIKIVFIFDFSEPDFFNFGSSGCFYSASLGRLVSGLYWIHHVSSPVTIDCQQFRSFLSFLIMFLQCWIRSNWRAGCIKHLRGWKYEKQLSKRVKNKSREMWWTKNISGPVLSVRIFFAWGSF